MRMSYVWAFLILLAIGGWMASGDIIVGGQGDSATAAAEDSSASDDPTENAAPGDAATAGEEQPFRVRVRTLEAQQFSDTLTIRGRTEVAQRVTLRAQTAGLVEELGADKGDPISAGDMICRIEIGSREANLLRAEAQLAQAEQDHTAATTLHERGHASETQLRQAKAALDAAQAALAEARLDSSRTAIRAPFDGVIESRPAEPGALLNVGDACAEVVARDPLLVTAEVSERDVGQLQSGMTGAARLVTGETAEGQITYISPTANADTRTFPIEMEVPNPEGRLRGGITAQLTVELEPRTAHRLSSAILTLGDDGQIGVRAVNDDRVTFLPVDVLASDRDSVWVAGLPETVTVITVGQDFVAEGQRVQPTFDTAESEP